MHNMQYVCMSVHQAEGECVCHGARVEIVSCMQRPWSVRSKTNNLAEPTINNLSTMILNQYLNSPEYIQRVTKGKGAVLSSAKMMLSVPSSTLPVL